MVNLMGNAKMAQEVYKTEHHLHNDEDWFGVAISPDAELHVADDILGNTKANPVLPFQMDAGDEVWGAWLQILGSSDTPNRPGNLFFDLHKFEVVASETTAVNAFIQIGCGATGAAALSALTYTTFPYITPTNLTAEHSIPFKALRCAVGNKAWARCVGMGEAGGLELDFYFGLHEYIK